MSLDLGLNSVYDALALQSVFLAANAPASKVQLAGLWGWSLKTEVGKFNR